MFTTAMERNSNSGHSVARALDILEVLAARGRPATLAELAEVTEAPKATLHRLLATLQSRGYVAQDAATSRYDLGVRYFETASRWARNLDVRKAALPAMKSLNEATGETVHLSVYDNGDAVYIEKIDGTRNVIPKSFVGRRCPATCVATGRVLLAHSSVQEINRVLSLPMPQYTERTVTDPAEIAALLATVREQGFATNHGNFRDEVGGLAAPIRDHTGAVIAAVGICLPEYRFVEDRFDQLRTSVMEAARTVQRELGAEADSLVIEATAANSTTATLS